MKVRTLDDIASEIDQKRDEMTIMAKSLGLTHENTIQSSHDLDELIYEFQIISNVERKRGKLYYSNVNVFYRKLYSNLRTVCIL